MGSYFTHNFISGLRGGADTSGDKLITLAEAYRFAYDRTVSATSVLPVGVQHPSYDFRLSGQGELVLASLVRPSATLLLPEGSERSLVIDVARDQVIVELPPGPIREVAPRSRPTRPRPAVPALPRCTRSLSGSRRQSMAVRRSA